MSRRLCLYGVLSGGGYVRREWGYGGVCVQRGFCPRGLCLRVFVWRGLCLVTIAVGSVTDAVSRKIFTDVLRHSGTHGVQTKSLHDKIASDNSFPEQMCRKDNLFMVPVLDI